MRGDLTDAEWAVIGGLLRWNAAECVDLRVTIAGSSTGALCAGRRMPLARHE